MDEKWLKDIVNQLNDYEAEAPAGLWEGIDARLKAGRGRSIRMTVLRIAAAVVLLAMLIGGGMFLYSPEIKELNGRSLAAKQSTYASALVSDVAESLETSVAVPHSQPTYHTISSQGRQAEQYPSQGQQAAQQPSQGQHVEQHPSQDQQVEPHSSARTQTAPRSSSVLAHASVSHSSSRRLPVRLSLLATNLISDRATSNGPGGAALMSSAPSSSQDPVKNPLHAGYGALDKHLIGNEGSRIYDQEKHHKQPVRVGVSVAYPLNDQLSIGLGLCYTYLSSDFKTGSERNYQSAHQSLHYLGLPLSVHYAFYRASRFAFYATAGMMGEKCVSGRSEIQTVSGSRVESERISLTEQRPQYSTFGSLGMQMDLVPRVGLYVEPGLSYYFDNHSRVVNVYKDKPLQFSLSAGVRFSF